MAAAPVGKRKVAAWVFLLALALTACQSQRSGGGGSQEVKTDFGVTSEPCPGSTHADRSCIYLGVLSDLTEGPFRALAVPITEAQKAFWKRVNDQQNGIGGKYDVDINTYTRDNKYNPEEQVAKFREIEPKILALAQSLGTPPTLATLPLFKENDVVAAPASWWSGWAFEDVVLESGHNYCIESMNGLDFAASEFGKPSTVMAVHYPGDYGGDSAAGVAEWAKVNGVAFDKAHNIQTLPNAQAGNQDAAVGAILKVKPDVVMLATGPAEMAEIVGKSVAQGFKGRFVGSAPTFNVALLKSEAAPAIKASYHVMAPWSPFGASDDAAHKAMQEAVGAGKVPANDGFTQGWMWSYALKAVLQKAFDNGDLTRAGVRKAVGEVTVDYEGAMPPKKYSGDPNENVVRTSLVTKPDDSAPLGLSVFKEQAVGPTAEKFQFTKPCQTAG
jgi:ABC-type branched-subunit amino acid transport system substrate-binding protein